MENNTLSCGAPAPKTKILTILTCVFGGLMVSFGIFEYLCCKLEFFDFCNFLNMEYYGINHHPVIYNLMFAVLVLVTIIKKCHIRFNGWLVLAVISSYLFDPYSQFQYSLMWSDITNIDDLEVGLFDFCNSYIPMTILVGYCMAILPLLWKRNGWTVTIAVFVVVMILCQRVSALLSDGIFSSWSGDYYGFRYSFCYLLFYNLMPILITLLLFYVMLRDAIMSANVQPAITKEAEIPANAVYCRNCGRPHAEDAEFCMNCGVRAGVGDKYCRVCGAKPDPLAEICVRCKTELKR